ncbi:MAG: DUF58 domain-containing protein [Verrucomicrobiota bacterium]
MNAPAYKFLPPELAGRLRGLGLTVRRPVEGTVQGLHRSPHHGSSVEFADYREYTRGDPPSLIDWAIYARSDRYVIRRYQEETNLRAHFLLDISESMFFREAGLHSKMDYACYLAAALMMVLLGQSDSAGLTLFNDEIRRTFPPVGSLEGLRPMLLALEEIKPSGRSQIEQALHQTAEKIRRRSLVILISDLLQEPAGIIRGIQHLRHNKHEVLILQPLDAGELSLNFGGLAELRELETGARLPVEADQLREAYANEVGKYLEEIRRGCVGSLADYHLIDTRTPVEVTLHAKFGQL